MCNKNLTTTVHKSKAGSGLITIRVIRQHLSTLNHLYPDIGDSMAEATGDIEWELERIERFIKTGEYCDPELKPRKYSRLSRELLECPACGPSVGRIKPNGNCEQCGCNPVELEQSIQSRSPRKPNPFQAAADASPIAGLGPDAHNPDTEARAKYDCKSYTRYYCSFCDHHFDSSVKQTTCKEHGTDLENWGQASKC